MTEIITKTGIKYEYDPNTQRIFRNDMYLSKSIAEPVYCGNDENNQPIFAGIYLVGSGEIVTKTGNVKRVVDLNTIK